MRYPDSTPTVFTGARQFVETPGMAVWLELCDTVMPDEWFNVTDVAGPLVTLRGYRQPERYLREVLKAVLADYQERTEEYDGRVPVHLRVPEPGRRKRLSSRPIASKALGFLIEQRVHVFIDTTTPTEPTMTTPSQIPATENEAWGFWGTMTENAAATWPIAMTAIAEATGQPQDAVRAFLDSRHGRHFADDVLNQMHAGLTLLDAVRAATLQWMGWKIGRQTCKQYGIPRGLPYLTGFVIYCDINEEELAN